MKILLLSVMSIRVAANVFGLCVRCLCALARVSESNDAKPVLYEGGISRTTLSSKHVKRKRKNERGK